MVRRGSVRSLAIARAWGRRLPLRSSAANSAALVEQLLAHGDGAGVFREQVFEGAVVAGLAAAQVEHGHLVAAAGLERGDGGGGVLQRHGGVVVRAAQQGRGARRPVEQVVALQVAQERVVGVAGEVLVEAGLEVLADLVDAGQGVAEHQVGQALRAGEQRFDLFGPRILEHLRRVEVEVVVGVLHADDGVAGQHDAEGVLAYGAVAAPAVAEGLAERVRAGDRRAGDQVEFVGQVRFDLALGGHGGMPALREAGQHDLARQGGVEPLQHLARGAHGVDGGAGLGRGVQVGMERIGGLADAQVVAADHHVALGGEVGDHGVVALGVADLLGLLGTAQRLGPLAVAHQRERPGALAAARHQQRCGGGGGLAVDADGGVGELGDAHVALGLVGGLVVGQQGSDRLVGVAGQHIALEQRAARRCGRGGQGQQRARNADGGQYAQRQPIPQCGHEQRPRN